MSEHEPLSENLDSREELRAAVHRLAAAQAELRDQMRDYAHNSLLTAAEAQQAFPAECARLQTAVAELQGRMVSGNYELPRYYRDDPADPAGDKLVVPFGNRLGAWHRPKQFVGVLADLAVINHRPTTGTGASVDRLVLAIDPAASLPAGAERDFYRYNYPADQFKQPFADAPEFAGRVYLSVDAVADLDLDYAYLQQLDYSARMLGRQATSDVRRDDA